MMCAWIMGHLNLVFLLMPPLSDIHLPGHLHFKGIRLSKGNTPWSKYEFTPGFFWTKASFLLFHRETISPTVTQLPTAYSALDSFWLYSIFVGFTESVGYLFRDPLFHLKYPTICSDLWVQRKSNMYSPCPCAVHNLIWKARNSYVDAYFSFGEMTITLLLGSVHVELQKWHSHHYSHLHILNFKLHLHVRKHLY